MARREDSPSGTTEKNGRSISTELLLDQIDAFRVLRADTPEARGAMLEKIAGRGKPEQDIVYELSKVRPLYRPDRFEEAHRVAMRSIEVLERNGSRNPTLRRLGPVGPIAKWMVAQATRWIVRSHLRKVLNSICDLYERREANSAWSTPEHAMLRRARLDASRVSTGMSGKPLGIPAFVLGGAFLTTIAGAAQSAAKKALNHSAGVVALAMIVVVLLAALSWVALYSAGVARHRIKLSTDQPMKALWETIGAAGDPPRDESLNFAVYAIVLLVLAWAVVPLGIILAIRA